MAINRQLRQEIGIETDREYMVLSEEVNEAWRNDDPEHFFVPPVGATDDFRYGMSLNPHMKAFITHGRYDLVTPYYASDRLRNLMRLDPEMAGRLTVRHFDGGHMFYAWEKAGESSPLRWPRFSRPLCRRPSACIHRSAAGTVSRRGASRRSDRRELPISQPDVTTRCGVRLPALAAIWGSSFLLIKIGERSFAALQVSSGGC